jgi:flagellin
MSQVINTNVLSLNAQRNLSTSGGQLAQSLQRLSSGMRINSAKDDAAGLSIADNFTRQIRGSNQAIRNANDGVSLAQVGEGALGEITNQLQRIRELAVQARNATNSTSDRAALQAEVNQRRDEIQRIASQTQFNGINLLNGTFSQQAFQVGANQGETINVDVSLNAQVTNLGEWNELGSSFEFNLDLSQAAVTTSVSSGGVTTFGTAERVFSITVGDAAPVQVTVAATTGAATAAAARTALATDLAAAVNVEFAGAAVQDGTSVALTLADSFSLSGAFIGQGSATDGDVRVGFAEISVANAAGADNSIRAMDAALNAINSARADLGAVQNRFESVIGSLTNTVENLSASRSRIMDTDFAAETAALTRAQVLQQAGVAMLSQANAAPQNVLALLR